LLKIMKKLLLLTLSFLFFYCGNSYSADCGDVTVVDCALTSSDDEIVIDNDWVDANGKKVTISSTGSIIVDDHDDDGLIRFREQVSDIEIENNGTLQVGEYDGVGTRSGEHNTITAKDGTATNLTITNNGVIAADGRNAIGLKAAEGNITITNNVGAIISAYQNAGTYGTINLATAGSTTAGNIKITNHGTIQANHTAHGSTNNAKTHSALRLDDISSGNTITVNNTGTIQAVRCCAVDLRDTTASIEIENSGTISAGTHGAIEGGGTTQLTIMNSGTITGTGTINPTSDVDREATIALASGSGATITNTSTGTIESSGNNLSAISVGDDGSSVNVSNVTITNSGTIAGNGTGDSIRFYEESTGGNIITKEEATYTGAIEMDSAAVTMTLDCSIKKDMDIEIHNKTNMTVTNNLCGNDTYAILDDSKDADADNSETNGYLRILGEDLEIDDENAKYRSENVLTKLRGLFDAANYINWHAPEDKFFKIFHSEHKREGTYKGSMSGVVGQLSPFILGDIRNNIFLGYTRQDGDFDNGEFLGGDNFALGLKSVYENNGFKASFTPMIGLNDLSITDFDTDTKTSISTNLLSEFAGFNGKFGKEIKTGEDSSLNLSVQSTLGLQRFPEYLAKFSDGDLSVDEAIEQVLSGGFEVRYTEELGKGFIIQPYIGANINNNFNNSIKITADGENKNVSPAYKTTTGYFAGISFTKEAKGINFDLGLMYGNEDGLINQIAAVSLTKSFGQSETKLQQQNLIKT